LITFYVIRIFFSGKIEQAPKTGAGGDLEKGRTGPLSLQMVDGAMVRDGKMGIFGKIEQIPNRSFWGEKRGFKKSDENRTGRFWVLLFVSGCGGKGCERALSDKGTCSNRSSGRAENERGGGRTGHFNVAARLSRETEPRRRGWFCRKEAQKAQKGTEGRREEETGGAEKRSGGQPLSGNGDATTEDTKDTERI